MKVTDSAITFMGYLRVNKLATLLSYPHVFINIVDQRGGEGSLHSRHLWRTICQPLVVLYFERRGSRGGPSSEPVVGRSLWWLATDERRRGRPPGLCWWGLRERSCGLGVARD